jgi:hypothetical protein
MESSIEKARKNLAIKRAAALQLINQRKEKYYNMFDFLDYLRTRLNEAFRIMGEAQNYEYNDSFKGLQSSMMIYIESIICCIKKEVQRLLNEVN